MEAVGSGSLLHARTDPLSNKVKRVRANPHVRVAISDLSGKPRGPWAEGEATIVEGEDMAEAVRAFRREYGTFRYALINVVGRLKGQRLSSVICIKIEPNSDDGKE
jgi:PPOX class probable F420-dependent enzyme